MYKLAVVALFALIAVAYAIPPLAIGISGVSHTQRVQSHIPLGVVGHGYGLVAPAYGLGYGYGGLLGAPIIF